MALLDSELQRIRYELGYPTLGVQAEPYVGIVAIFNTVIQQYITSGAKTTSSTPVTAASSGPAVTSLTLASSTGFTAGDRVVVDVDKTQEAAVVQSVSGPLISLELQLAHSGTYPVTVEGGETIVRDLVRQLVALGGPQGQIEKVSKRAGIKKVDEVEFFGGGTSKGSQGKSAFDMLVAQREYLRNELAHTLGVERLNRRNGGGGCVLA